MHINCNESFELFDFEDQTTVDFLEALWSFRNFYNSFHRYIAVVLCVCGLLANSIHIWVLTRPRMRDSSVHTVLTCIAVSDMGTMTSYLIYMSRFEFLQNTNGYPYGWALFLKIHVVLSIALHAITLYLVVLMAFIRFSAMRLSSSRWLQTQRALITSIVIAAIVFFLCMPTLLAHQISAHRSKENGRVVIRYSVNFSDMVIADRCLFMKANLWLTGIALKAIPCILLFWFTVALISRLRQNSKKRKLLLKEDKQRRRGDVTTFMLLLMVAVFLTTELPQGVTAILNAINTTQFHRFVYTPLADILDLLSLINCYVAFLVYICTCSKYRQTLLSILPNMPESFSIISTRQNTVKQPSNRGNSTQFKDVRARIVTSQQTDELL